MKNRVLTIVGIAEIMKSNRIQGTTKMAHNLINHNL